MRRPKPARMRTGAPIDGGAAPERVGRGRAQRGGRARSAREPGVRAGSRAGVVRRGRNVRCPRRRASIVPPVTPVPGSMASTAIRRPPEEGTKESAGALRSTATARSTRVTLPAVSVASTPTVCRPSGSAPPSEVERSVDLRARRHGPEVARRPERLGLAPVDQHPQQADADGVAGAEAQRLVVRRASRAPPAGRARSPTGLRDVAHGHDRAGDAEPGEREALRRWPCCSPAGRSRRPCRAPAGSRGRARCARPAPSPPRRRSGRRADPTG